MVVRRRKPGLLPLALKRGRRCRDACADDVMRVNVLLRREPMTRRRFHVLTEADCHAQSVPSVLAVMHGTLAGD